MELLTSWLMDFRESVTDMMFALDKPESGSLIGTAPLQGAFFIVMMDEINEQSNGEHRNGLVLPSDKSCHWCFLFTDRQKRPVKNFVIKTENIQNYYILASSGT